MFGQRGGQCLAFVEPGEHAVEHAVRPQGPGAFGERLERLDERQAGIQKRHQLLGEHGQLQLRLPPQQAEAPDRRQRDDAQVLQLELAACVALVDRIEYAGDYATTTVQGLDAIFHRASPVAEVSVFSAATGLTVAAEGLQVEIITVRAGLGVDVGVPPRVQRHGLL